MSENINIKIAIEGILQQHLIEPYKKYFNDPEITEIALNGENSSYIEKNGEWQEIDQHLNINKFNSISRVIANSAEIEFGETIPVLSGTLSTGERIQVTRPPASKEWSITIRKFSEKDFTLEEIEKFGNFQNTKVDYRIPDSFFEDALVDDKTKKIEENIKESLEKREFIKFFDSVILTKKNIIISGATGSGKTTFTKALIHRIPSDERLITIEDAEEIRFENHKNFVQLFFDRYADKDSIRTAQNMLLSCMRMKPDRILVSEIRGSEALTFLESVVSGHPGSMTTLHANSVGQAKEKMVMMMLQGAVEIPIHFLERLIEENIHVFVQINKVKNKREVTGILYQGM